MCSSDLVGEILEGDVKPRVGWYTATIRISVSQIYSGHDTSSASLSGVHKRADYFQGQCVSDEEKSDQIENQLFELSLLAENRGRTIENSKLQIEEARRFH